jgi:phosphoribosylaminoimidazole synthetase
MVDANMPVAAFYLANSMYVHGDGYGHGYGDWSVGGLYSIGTSRTCGIFSSGVDVNSVIAENDQLVRLVYGDLHFRRDIGKKMLDMLKKGCGYGDDRDSDRDSRKDKDLNVVGMNYLGHLNNYNHIITDVKKEIDRHNNAMELAKPGLKVLGRIGDFANSVEWSKCRMICSVDGAGTKTKFLEGHPRRFEILGRDIVVHNINDMYCNNGRPIALLDYYGCDKLDKREFAEFVNGALEVCKKYGIALIGGETAEMRGIFQTGEVEVLGILLGVLDDGVDVANGYNIKAGHVVYGLESHGAHTNGFTKLREVASRAECNNSSSGSSSSSWSVSGMPLEVREFFSQPHRCYVPVVEGIKKLLQQDSDGNHEIVITGKAHITGGGFIDNIERILPDGLKLELEGWPLAMEWQWLIQNAKMEWDEFIRVFNAGWGFCLVLNNEIPDDILRKIEFDNGLGKIKKIGKIVRKQ